MRQYRFRIVNVFAKSTFGGNPLCVFEDARGLADGEMQAIARQFNLSETTFILPSTRADALVRVFTTGYEMRFAGHPTLGTAHVLRALRGAGDRLRLEFLAGVVPVEADGDFWTLTAPTQGAPVVHAPLVPGAVIAALLGLEAGDIAAEPLWVDTGADQLLVPVRSADAVRRAAPDASRLSEWPLSSLGRKTAYVFAVDGNAGEARNVVARYFFTTAGNGVSEDPGTGSACANLGGWWLHQQRDLPLTATISQGDGIGRPCRLSLRVDLQHAIRVGGRVQAFAQGSITL
jgi:trans-2,3-dihydro-3-hydroxyanthranilate isomerase